MRNRKGKKSRQNFFIKKCYLIDESVTQLEQREMV